MRTAVVAAAVALAETVAASDLELGRYLAAECLTCHRAAAGQIPTLFGRTEADLVALIQTYRDGTRPSPVMQTIAGRLREEEIAALARYFAVTRQP